jgi:NAD(P)-dependent dehydrogenase (short-subunit alcohol dehydrogenase family)
MGRTVLVVEGETPLGRSLVRLLRQTGYRVVATYRKTDKAETNEDGADVLRAPWGKASPVSARNVMLKTMTACEHLDMAVFTFSPALQRVLLHEVDYVEMESVIDEWIRGTLFLMREVLDRLVRQGSGALVLAQSFTGANLAEHAPLEAMVRGALHELTGAILGSYGGEGVSVYRFETSSARTDEYVRYIVKTLSATPPPRPRTYRFRAHRGLLERLGLRAPHPE